MTPQVGTPVRIRTVGCRERWKPNPKGVSIRGHIPTIDGRLGIVTADHRLCTDDRCRVEGHDLYALANTEPVNREPSPCRVVESHPWHVEFDRAIVLPTGHRITGAFFAENELEAFVASDQAG